MGKITLMRLSVVKTLNVNILMYNHIFCCFVAFGHLSYFMLFLVRCSPEKPCMCKLFDKFHVWLQAPTLPNATPPIGKINLFSQMTVTFEPLMQF